MMIELYVAGLFILGCVSLYSLIISKTNRWLVFILVPLILVMSLYTWKAITVLQGKPIMAMPIDENVEIIFVTNQKPTIFFLLRHEDDFVPRYYAIPWTEENAKKIARLENMKKAGLPLEGKIVIKQRAGGSESPSLDWEQTRSYQITNPKNAN